MVLIKYFEIFILFLFETQTERGIRQIVTKRERESKRDRKTDRWKDRETGH
jgi:hypothetical protein